MTIGGQHWINDVLGAAGYRNVFAELDRGVFQIAPEAALAYKDLPRISLNRLSDQGRADPLTDLLARPGPGLGDAVKMLCKRRLKRSPVRAD